MLKNSPFGEGHETTQNCSRLWAGIRLICAACSSGGMEEIPQSWESSKGMPSGTSREQFFHLGWQMAEQGLFGLMLMGILALEAEVTANIPRGLIFHVWCQQPTKTDR